MADLPSVLLILADAPTLDTSAVYGDVPVSPSRPIITLNANWVKVSSTIVLVGAESDCVTSGTGCNQCAFVTNDADADGNTITYPSGVVSTTTTDYPQTIKCTVPALKSGGAKSITVKVNAASSAADTITYLAPDVTSVSPADVSLAGLSIVITGMRFVAHDSGTQYTFVQLVKSIYY